MTGGHNPQALPLTEAPSSSPGSRKASSPSSPTPTRYAATPARPNTREGFCFPLAEGPLVPPISLLSRTICGGIGAVAPLPGRISALLAAVSHRLQRPAVAIGILEENEASPREHLNVAHIHAAVGQLAPRVLCIIDDHLQPVDGPGRHLVGTRGERDRAGRAGRGQLYEAKFISHLVVRVGGEAHLLDVERLCPVDVGYRDLDELEAHLTCHS